MADEPFLMVSLKDDEAKKLANALTNKSANKILSYLAKHEGATEKQLSQALKIPVSTINYTMKVLVEARLVVADEYSYSQKGREVNHYRLAKKYIIIAPDEEREGFFDKLKKYLPAAGIVAGGAVIAQLATMFWPQEQAAQAMMMRTESSAAADMALQESTSIPIAEWLGPLLLGAFLMILAGLLVEYIRKR